MRRESAALAVVTACLAGCSHFEIERGTPVAEQPPAFVVGATRMTDVLHVLGPPFRLTATPDGLAFLYEEVATRETQVGISLSAFRLEYLKVLFAWGKADRRALLLAFDQDGLLSAQEHEVWTEDLGRGSTIQPVFVAVPIVDTSRLEEDPPALDWAGGLLRPLPETLNASQSLDSGQSGLEQLATPGAVGQHRLEFR